MTIYRNGYVNHGKGSVIVVRDGNNIAVYVVGKDIEANKWYRVTVDGASENG